jgi:hypothetical protein
MLKEKICGQEIAGLVVISKVDTIPDNGTLPTAELIFATAT